MNLPTNLRTLRGELLQLIIHNLVGNEDVANADTLCCHSTGNPNQYVHIWVYDSAADRETKRKAMSADPDWIKYTQESAKFGGLANQENKLMTPVGFFPNPR